MSALNWGGGAGTNATPRYFTFTSPALPDSDWAIGIWVRRNAITGSSEQRLWSIGVPNTTDSLYHYMGEVTLGRPWGSNVTNAAGTNWINTAPVGTVTQNGQDYLAIIQRRSNVCEVYFVRKGTGAIVSFSQTSISGTFSSQGGAIGYDTSGGGDPMRNPLGDFFIFDDRSLSLAEITALSNGQSVRNIALPKVLLEFRYGERATEVNAGSGGATYNATRVSTGFAEQPEFFDANPRGIGSAYTSQLALAIESAPLPNSALYDINSWVQPHAADVGRWFADELNSGGAPATIATTPGDATAAGATALIDQKRVIATTTGDATAGGLTALINNARVIATTTGNAVANGATAQIDQQRKISTVTGNAVADGTTAQINQARTIATTTGDAVANGVTAQVGSNLTVTTTTGNAVADGVTAKINQARAISTATGNAVADGPTAQINGARVIGTITGNAVADGVQALLDQKRTVTGIVGNAVADGATAAIDQKRSIAATPSNAVADGVQARIDAQRVIAASPGNAVADGQQASVGVSITIATTPGNAVADGIPASIVLGLDRPPQITLGGSGREQGEEAIDATDPIVVSRLLVQMVAAVIASGALDG